MDLHYYEEDSLMAQMFKACTAAQEQGHIVKNIDLTEEDLEQLRDELDLPPMACPSNLMGTSITVEGYPAQAWAQREALLASLADSSPEEEEKTD